MRSFQYMGSAVALAGYVSAQAVSKASCDAAGICYQTYTEPTTNIQYGIALPQSQTPPFDAIISITAPIATKWAGFAWGGTMVWNPLTVAWPNGKTSVVSSRFAFGQGLPNGYDGAEYTLLKGTTTNSTHWTMVAACSGCTSWQANDDSTAVVNGTTATFAWAYSTTAVQDPTNNGSAFNVHTSVGHWTHDLSGARNAKFASWVSANRLAPAPTSGPAGPASGTAAASSTLATSVVSSAPKPSVGSKGAVPASCSGAGAAQFPGVLANGWKATKVLGGLTSPRSLVVDSQGNMLMVQSGKGISVHKMGTDGCVTATKMLVSLNSLNHGITLSPDGKTLYASSMTQVYSWPYDATAQTVGTRATIITGMYNGGAHTTRTLLMGAHAPNLLVVSHGSNDNFDYAAGNPKTGRAIIKVFDITKVPSSGSYNYVNDGYLAGYGMRNEVGITFDGNNMMWGVENSGDNFQRKAMGQTSQVDVHQNNPAEKLNYIGDITKPNNNWYGYPTCFTVWQPSDFRDATFKIGDQFVIAPNSTFKDSDCAGKMTTPSLSMMAHSAPIDAKFDADFSNLYVTFHGSWNRSPTTGFKLVVVPFTKGSDGGYKPVAGVDTQTGYTDVFSNKDVTKCTGNGPSFSSGCFRPAGLVFDSAQRLYMTSDVTSNAELWVLGKQ